MTIRIRHRLAAAVLASLAVGVPVAMAPALAQEQAEARAVSINDLFQLRQAGQVMMAPDGGQVVFTVSVPRDLRADDSDGTPSTQLYVADAPGALRALVAGEDTASGVALHPDGESVTYLTNREGDERPALYRMALAGGEP